jgi:hypothetical protein
MEFEAYLKIGSCPIEITEDRKSKQRHLIQLFFFCDWDTLKYEIPMDQLYGLSFFHNIFNGLPLRINSISEPILFADDTSVMISSRNF